MEKCIYKYSYYIICTIFIIALISVTVIRDQIKNEIGVLIINYGYWYSFGLLSGFSIAVFIHKRN